MTEAGLFSIDQTTRTARGVLLPYNVKSKGTSASNTAPITFQRGNVTIPRDPMVVSLNDEHARFKVIGRATELVDTDAGVVATFTLADTDAADAWLAEHGTAAYFSAEIDELRRAPGDIGYGIVAGAAVTVKPAFDGTAVALFSLIGEETTTPDPAPAEPDPQPDEEPDPQPDEEPDEPEEDAVADAVVPNTMLASRRKADAPALTKAGFFAAYAEARRTGSRDAIEPYIAAANDIGLFALSNVKFDGTGGLVSDSLHPGTWLGQLWQGKTFQRRIVPLLTQGTLTSLNATGWVWGVKPAMAAWAGNKTAVPSNAPTVTPKAFPATRFAGGHDLAREYYDFNVTDVIDSYAEMMVDSYAKLSDAYALTQLTAGATVYTPDAGNTVNKGLLDIVDGALKVIANGGTPSWAVVAPDIFKGIIATPREDSLIFLDAAIGLETGSSAGFGIVPDARLAAGAIIVGDKAGATAWELPGVPIRVQALDLALGGVDNAFFGYIGVGVTNPAVVVKNAAAGLLEGVEEDVAVAAEKSRSTK